MSTPTTTTNLRILLGFDRLDDADLSLTGYAALAGMTGNDALNKPPIDLVTVKTVMDGFSTCMTEAVDGGKKAITAKNKQRKVVVSTLRQLATYVEANCNGDLAVLTSSGFKAAPPRTRTANQAVSVPSIAKVTQGVSGQLIFRLKSDRRATSHEFHWAALSGTTPGTWTTITVVGLRAPVVLNNLTPGTTYAFQVRALGPLGFSDWSDSVTRMCI